MAFDARGLGIQHTGTVFGAVVTYLATDVTDTLANVQADDYFKVNKAVGSDGYWAEKRAYDSIVDAIQTKEPQAGTGIPIVLQVGVGGTRVNVRNIYADTTTTPGATTLKTRA